MLVDQHDVARRPARTRARRRCRPGRRRRQHVAVRGGQLQWKLGIRMTIAMRRMVADHEGRGASPEEYPLHAGLRDPPLGQTGRAQARCASHWQGPRMPSLFDLLTKRLVEVWKRPRAPGSRRAYRCICQRPVFFRNSMCLACKTPLGYECELGRIAPLAPGPNAEGCGDWPTSADGKPGSPEAAVPALRQFRFGRRLQLAGAGGRRRHVAQLCIACRLNRTIPDLDDADNRVLWQRIETAKRRLVSQLLSLGLPVESRDDRGPRARPDVRLPALAARRAAGDDRPRQRPDHAQHRGGRRRRARADRARSCASRIARCSATCATRSATTTGTGWSSDTPWLEPFRELFGDERADYAAALKQQLRAGPAGRLGRTATSAPTPAMHPWEDWAETWAHYLHMVDRLDTALGFGLDAEDVEIDSRALRARRPLCARRSRTPSASSCFLNSWVELTMVLNELAPQHGAAATSIRS